MDEVYYCISYYYFITLLYLEFEKFKFEILFLLLSSFLLVPSKLKFSYKGIFFYDEEIDKEWKCLDWGFFTELKLLLLLLLIKLLLFCYKRVGDYKFLVEDLLKLVVILLGLYILMTSIGVGCEYFFNTSFELNIFF